MLCFWTGSHARSHIGDSAVSAMPQGGVQQPVDRWSCPHLVCNSLSPSLVRPPDPSCPCHCVPQEGMWQWVDIWNCLNRERIIFLSKPVDEELGNQVRANAAVRG